jgi:hypothetical protein
MVRVKMNSAGAERLSGLLSKGDTNDSQHQCARSALAALANTRESLAHPNE